MIDPSDEHNRPLAHRRASAPSSPLEHLRADVLGAAEALAQGDGRSASGDRDGSAADGEPGSGIGASARSGRGAITLERPPRAEFGDYSTNAALLLAPGLGPPPREVAERLGKELERRLGASLERFEVAGPGFLNLFLSDSWLISALADVLDAGELFGAGGAEAVEHMLIEFVSANPTGPMHVGHARNAAYGDALARMLALHGHRVEREFYVNDAGSQVHKLGESILALARGEPVPEDGYKGDYVVDLVAGLPQTAAVG